MLIFANLHAVLMHIWGKTRVFFVSFVIDFHDPVCHISRFGSENCGYVGFFFFFVVFMLSFFFFLMVNVNHIFIDAYERFRRIYSFCLSFLHWCYMVCLISENPFGILILRDVICELCLILSISVFLLFWILECIEFSNDEKCFWFFFYSRYKNTRRIKRCVICR